MLLVVDVGNTQTVLGLYDGERRILVSGDQVLPTILPNVSVLSSRPDADPLREFLESLTRLQQCAEDTLVLPSHGRPFRGLHGRLRLGGLPEPDLDHHGAVLAQLRLSRGRTQARRAVMRGDWA